MYIPISLRARHDPHITKKSLDHVNPTLKLIGIHGQLSFPNIYPKKNHNKQVIFVSCVL